jgi:heme-degrading monooxygenase HmoA
MEGGDCHGRSIRTHQRFEVPAGSDEDLIRVWEVTRGYLQTQPGYVKTALHQAISPDADFRFVNVGAWESPQHFRHAINSPGFVEVAGALGNFKPHPGLYRVVRT